MHKFHRTLINFLLLELHTLDLLRNFALYTGHMSECTLSDFAAQISYFVVNVFSG